MEETPIENSRAIELDNMKTKKLEMELKIKEQEVEQKKKVAQDLANQLKQQDEAISRLEKEVKAQIEKKGVSESELLQITNLKDAKID